jgi:hypothetical protein
MENVRQDVAKLMNKIESEEPKNFEENKESGAFKKG